MRIHLNSCLIHPKRKHLAASQRSQAVCQGSSYGEHFSLVSWGTPDAFVLRLFSSCVKAPRTKAYLWRVEYTQWAQSQQLNPVGSHSWKADHCIQLSLLTDELTGKLDGGTFISFQFIQVVFAILEETDPLKNFHLIFFLSVLHFLMKFHKIWLVSFCITQT